MQESAVPAYITSLPFCGSSGRYTRRLRKSKGQGSPLREGSAAPGSHRPPGSHRNEHELVARHRAAHGDRTTTHGGRRPERILGFELARTAGSLGPANRAASVFWGATSTTLICEGRRFTVGR